MKKQRKLPKEDQGSNDENLRGRFRELQKEVKKLRHYITKLEHEKDHESAEELESDTQPQPSPEDMPLCRSCRSNKIKIVFIPKRDGELTIAACEDCGAREKIK
jgi:hypothetical protein